MTPKPAIVKEAHLDFLDALRESGVVNMWGAGVYVEKQFHLSARDASTVCGYWMKTFSQRHPKGGVQ